MITNSTTPDQQETSPAAQGLVHVSAMSGHRREYQELFARIFDLSPSVGSVGGHKLIEAKRLFFATLDDDILGFAIVALRRAMRRRRTVGLFLRPQSCLGTAPRAWAKRLVMRALCALPGVSVLSIIPFDFLPGIASVCTDWGHDPQLWDQLDAPTEVSAATLTEIACLAQGRPILAFLGRASRIKGLPKLVALLTAQPDLLSQISVILAGSVDTECQVDAARLMALGATVWDRRISDAELSALYQAADLVWANYDASYDQASGIFGRAVQWGRPVVVREGAMIGCYADALNHPCLRLSNNPVQAAQQLSQFIGKLNIPKDLAPSETLQQWRAEFIAVVRGIL